MAGEHADAPTVTSTGNRGEGTAADRSDTRNHDIACAGRPVIRGSADPGHLGDAARHIPEDLPVASLSAGQPEAAFGAVSAVVTAPGAGAPAMRGVSPRGGPGEAVGIAGSPDTGKSTPAKALAGVWPPVAGKVTLGGATLEQYGEAALARHVGWLPQEVVLFAGTMAENIARLDPEPDDLPILR